MKTYESGKNNENFVKRWSSSKTSNLCWVFFHLLYMISRENKFWATYDKTYDKNPIWHSHKLRVKIKLVWNIVTLINFW